MLYVKAAVIACAEQGHLPIVQIHDELCFNVKDDKDVAEIKKAMETCVELIVPSVIDVAPRVPRHDLVSNGLQEPDPARFPCGHHW